MAFGIVPHHSVAFSLDNLSEDQFLVLAGEMAANLYWTITYTRNGFVAYTKFRRTSINEKITLSIDSGLATMKSESTGGQLMDWGRNKRNIHDFIAGYDQLRDTMSPEELDRRTESVRQQRIGLESDPEDLSGEFEATERSKGFLSLFIPVKGYFVTPLMIDINIIVFLMMIISGVNVMFPDTASLLNWGANFRPYTLDGQPWRLLTNCFLHIGILHLLFNMYALLYIGILMEPRLGSRRFAVAYIMTGIFASIASVYWHPLTVSAGASGAIFGMYGVFLAMLTTNLIEKTQRKALLTSIGVFVGYNLLNGMKGGIDGAAHVGGLISGILLGYSFYFGMAKPQDPKLNYGIPFILIVVLCGFSFWMFNRISTDIVQYNNKIKVFAEYEENAMRVYQAPAGTPREELLSQIKDSSLWYWNKSKDLIANLDKLNIPSELHKRDEILSEYCDFRIKSTELIYKSVYEDTKIYNSEIRDYMDSINTVLKKLK